MPNAPIQKKLHAFVGVFIITLIWFVLFASNYVPGTWLTGWDNLHPEFSISTNIARSLFPAWQEYQGVGLLGGMGHGADLIRQCIIALLLLFSPSSVIRYLLVFASLWIGSVGTFFFTRELLSRHKPSLVSLSSFLAGIFYLLNLGTIQNFYVPFEPFYWFFAFLPWLFLSLLLFLQTEKKEFAAAFLFFIVSVLASPLGYLQTAFLVYSLGVGVILLSYLLAPTRKLLPHLTFFKKIQRVFVVISIIFATNAFWFLPVAYFTITNAQVTVNAKINQIATPEVIAGNQTYGNLKDIALLKGYWLSLHDFQKNKDYAYLLSAWNTHLTTFPITYLGYIFFFIILCGVLYSVKLKSPIKFGLFFLFLLCVLMLVGENPPTGVVITELKNTISLFGQIFRSPYTKWIVPTIFIYAVLFGVGIYGLLTVLNRIAIKNYIPKYFIGFLITIGLIVFTFPAFEGHLIYSATRIKLPIEYEHLFQFFQQQPKQRRIAFIPLQTLWGWNFYDWQYRGSGFLWYGIEQPILDRAFDVWSPYNESFYQEASTALYQKDFNHLNEVLKKYDVSFLLKDKNVIEPKKNQNILFFEELDSLVEKMPNKKEFAEENLEVTSLSNNAHGNNFLYAPEAYSYVQADTDLVRKDVAYAQEGNYVESQTKDRVIFPFADLYQEKLSDLEYVSDTQLQLTKKLPELSDEYEVLIPAVASGSSYLTQAEIRYQNSTITLDFPTQVQISLGDESYTLPKLSSLTLKLPQRYKEVILEINKQQYSLLASSEKSTLPLKLTIGQPFSVDVFDKDAIKEINGQYIISDDDITSLKVPSSYWKNFIGSGKTFSVPSANQNLQVKIEEPPIPIEISQIHNLINCDVLKRGKVEERNEQSSVTYLAEGFASACEGIALPTLAHNQSYIVRMKGENNEGRGIKLSVQNLGTQRVDLEVLPKDKKFDTSYVLLANPSAETQGYFFNLEVRSFGQSAKSSLENIHLFSFPLDYLSRIQVVPKKQAFHIQNTVEVQNTWKFGTHEYGAKMNVKEREGLLVLSQGYDSGWIAFSQQKPLEWFEHIKYNGWANGWILPPGEHTIILLYWPQLLSFTGYTVLFITSLGFFITGFRSLFVRSKRDVSN
jgi:hypothetical protein